MSLFKWQLNIATSNRAHLFIWQLRIPRGLKHGQIVRQHLPQQQQQQHQKHPDIIKMTTIPARVSKGNKSPNGALHKWVWVHEIVSSSSFIDKVCRLRLGYYDQYMWWSSLLIMSKLKYSTLYVCSSEVGIGMKVWQAGKEHLVRVYLG